MGDLRDRLRRAAQMAPPPSAEAAAPAAPASKEPTEPGLPSVRARLRRREERSAARPEEAAAAEPHRLPPGFVSAPGPLGETWVRELRAPLEDVEELLTADVGTLALLARDERLHRLDLRRAVFLDTETTSLSGGAGVLVFLVGLGRVDAQAGEFCLRQHFMVSPTQERSMLAGVAADLARSESVVTFFGKSFDRHRLEDKFTIHGLTSHFPTEIHADLYHVTRARFGWKLADCRLRTAEESLLGIRRVDDLPGSEAPKAYFDFLARRPTLLPRVVEHNERDVLSLPRLLARLAKALPGSRAQECLAGMKAALATKQWETAKRMAEAALGGAPPVSRELELEGLRGLAEATKRLSGAEAALPIWTRLAELGCVESALDVVRQLERTGAPREARASALARVRGFLASMAAGPQRDQWLSECERAARKVGL